jgi:leucyl aminopeptidase (aminopeptidase T)
MPTKTSSRDLPAQVARSVLRQNIQLKPGENVLVEGWTHTLPWAVAFAREARRMGAFPLLHYEDENSFWNSVEDGEDKILGAAPTHEWAAIGKTDVYLHMWGPGDRVRMQTLPEARQDRVLGFNGAWYRAAAKAGLRGARMELGRPFPTLAKAYKVDEYRWRRDVVAGMMVAPEKLRQSAAPLARALKRGTTLRIQDDRGTDLVLGLAGREPRINWGRLGPRKTYGQFGMLLNLPAGAVRVALDEKVAQGTLVANRTCYYEDGMAKGACFHFEKGKLTSADFDSGRERFDKPFRKAGKGKDQPGFLSIGLNPELKDTPQVEDIEQGAVMVSVGGNQGFGGNNAAQFFGWAITAGAQVTVDGRSLPIPG